jgi:mannose-6-phosphate isomerase-like protein (cupin superfamily)
VRVGSETAEIHKGDAVPVRLNEPHSLTSTGGDLELMVVGISTQKNVLDTELGAPAPR